MHLKKSIISLIIAIVLLFAGLILTKMIISRDKWLYIKISTFNNSDNQIERNLIDLDTYWYVSTEDSIAFSFFNYNDKNWNTDRYVSIALIRTPNKFLWVRKHFIAPEHIPSDTLLLKLSLNEINAEVYINGVKIADSCFIYNRSVCCYLPTALLKKGKSNVIALRSRSMLANPENAIKNFKDQISYVLKPEIDLKGIWKFSFGDNINWMKKEFNDSAFKNIYAPLFWDFQGYKYHIGLGWYRKNFTVPEKMRTQKLVLITGKIDDYGEVYINGTKVGGHIVRGTNLKNTEFDTYGLYLLDGNMLSANNTVAIRVINDQKRGGIYQGPLGIITLSDYLKFIDWK